MKDKIDIKELIGKFEDMKERGTLLTGPSVTQKDVFIQIVGTIVSVAMDQIIIY